MLEQNKLNNQLIIELAKLRNKVYELEDRSSEKSALNKRVEELEEKLEHKTDSYKKLNNTVKTLIADNMQEINDMLTEYENMNEKPVLETVVKKINNTLAGIKDAIES